MSSLGWDPNVTQCNRSVTQMSTRDGTQMSPAATQLPHQLSWFCNCAMGIPHHNIMDKREELRIPEDLTVREGRCITEDTSSGCARFFFTFACCQGEEWVCFQAVRLHQVGLSVSETLSLYHTLSLSLISFDLLSLLPIRLYYTVSSCIPTS